MALGARTLVIRSLFPQRSDRLLDVGCGPISSDYPYADKASTRNMCRLESPCIWLASTAYRMPGRRFYIC